MEREIKIGDKTVTLSNCVAWTIEYRDQFGKDPLEALMPIMTSLIETITTIANESGAVSKGEINITDIASALEGRAFDITLPLMQLGFVDSVFNVVWAMAKAANEGLPPPKTWARQFDEFPLDEIVPTVYEMMLKGFSSSKNLERLKRLLGNIKTNQPSQSTPSSSPASNEG